MQGHSCTVTLPGVCHGQLPNTDWFSQLKCLSPPITAPLPLDGSHPSQQIIPLCPLPAASNLAPILHFHYQSTLRWLLMQIKAEYLKAYHLWALPLGPSHQEAHLPSVSDLWIEEGTPFPGSAPVNTAQDTEPSSLPCRSLAYLQPTKVLPLQTCPPLRLFPGLYFTPGPEFFRPLWMAAPPLSYLLTTRTSNMVSLGKCYLQQFITSHFGFPLHTATEKATLIMVSHTVWPYKRSHSLLNYYVSLTSFGIMSEINYKTH